MAIRADRVGVREDQVDIHGRVTSPSFFNELLEDLPEWTDMPVWVNGTEELLPSNNSVPVTSPILADIAYPDIRRDNQYFTYRESPTPVDGLAKIKSIKGNTLVWNQLANVGTLNATAGYNGYLNIGTFSFVANHKYLIKYHQDNAMSSNTRNTLQVRFATVGQTATENAAANAHLSQGDYSWLFNSTYTDTNTIVRFWVADNDVSVSYSNIMVIDLTQMGLDSITDPSDFTSLFNLPYYAYNQGSLLSFNGNGIKTVGFNQWDEEWETGAINTVTGQNSSSSSRIRSKNYIPIIPTETYYCKAPSTTYVFYYDSNYTYLGYGVTSVRNSTFNPSSLGFGQASYFRFRCDVSGTYNNDICINISSSKNGTYEPYTSHTTNLPIATYFPTGMKSAGTVYDELTPRKAITRIGMVDLGTLTWSFDKSHSFFASYGLNGKETTGPTGKGNALCAKYPTVTNREVKTVDKSMAVGAYYGSGCNVYIKDTSYSDVASFKTAMSGVYLFYELATPVELPTMSFE